MRRRLSRVSARDISLTILFTIGIIWMLSLIWDIWAKEQRAREGTTETRKNYDALLVREAKLESDLASLETTRGKEAVLRDSQGVARPGEEVIIVVPAEPVAPPPPPRTWWQRFLDWL